MSTTALQPAFVLHRRAYRDTSLLLELTTRDSGRVAAVARGARGGRGHNSGLLQPFYPLLVGFAGRGEVGTLTGAEPAGVGFALQGTGLYCGLYVNELMLYLTQRQDGNPELFAAYLRVLGDLAGGADAGQALRTFELDLLMHVGFAVRLTTESDGETPISEARRYDYRPEAGPVPAAQGVVSGATLLALDRRAPLLGEQRREARQLLRAVLAHQLGGRELRSRELFRGTTRP